MKNKVKNTSDRFKVLVNGLAVLVTGDREKAQEKIIKLQLESTTLIVFLDTEIKQSVQYKKTMHQRNYRIIQGDYEKDSAEPKIQEEDSKEESKTDWEGIGKTIIENTNTVDTTTT